MSSDSDRPGTTRRAHDARLRLGSRIVIAIAAASLSPPALAQRWEPIPAGELSSAASPMDPSAGSEALFWKVWVDDEVEGGDLRSVRRHHVRVKVYSAEAAQEWATYEIRFPARGVRIHDVQARTVQPDGSVQVMEGRAVSRETLVRYQGEQLRSVKFAPPGVRPGCVVEFRYREVRDDWLAHYEVFLLQREVPARRIEYHLKPLTLPGWAVRQMSFQAPPAPGDLYEDGYHVVRHENVRAFRSEPHMPPELMLRAWMLIYYTQERLTLPATYWREKGVEWTRDFNQAAKSDALLRETARLATAGAADDEGRLRKLAEWCRREIRVVRSDHRDSTRGLQDPRFAKARETIARRVGTPYDLDVLFGALARAAGFDVRFVRVPNRSRVHFTQEMMDPRFVSSYQVAVRRGAAWRSYDPQARWLPWDMVPWDEQAQLGLVCNGDSSFFLETPIAEPPRSERARRAELVLEESGDLAGEVHVCLTGHWNASLREALEEEADTLAVFREQLDWEDTALQLSAIRFQPVEDEHEEFRATLHVRIPGHAVSTGARLLLEPAAWWARRAPEFKESQRRWPVEFPFAWSDRDTLRIRLPAGWRPETLPAPKPVSAEGVLAFDMLLRSGGEDGVLECLRAFDMGYDGSIYFPASSYADVRKVFDLIHDRDRTSVPLVRNAGAR